jgi:eukaryotic-like serine/threonine-protein kinase
MKRLVRRVSRLFSELKRRKVFRVSGFYVASAFVVAQVADIFLPGLGFPDWALRLVLVVLVLGFPVAVVLAWMFDLTPEGIRRTNHFAPAAGEEPPPSVSPPAGAELGDRYALLERIGAGAMGVVYRARDRRLQREVALKFLPEGMGRDPAAEARFLQEARAAAALNHPNITTLHAIEDDGGRPFLVMELVDGETLEERLARGGPLPVADAKSIAGQIAAGLSAAHDKGIVHRDIKLANVMITGDGRVKIMDFGIAKVPGGPAMTRAGSTLGSAAYMSPEQVRGRSVDARSDIWAWGVVLYELLTGRLPFPGDNEHSVLHGVLSEDPPPVGQVRREVPADLAMLVMQSLNKVPSNRPASAREILSTLGGTSDVLGSSPFMPATARPARSLRHRLALAVPVVLALVVVAGWMHRRSAAESWARDVEIPAVLAMVEAQDCLGVMMRASELERILPGDRYLREARNLCSVPTNVVSDPPGADVYLRAYGRPDADWFHLGTTPMHAVAVPEGLYHWRIEAPGFEVMEKGMHAWEAETLTFELIPEGERPADMVRVTGGPTTAYGVNAELGPFWIDRYEVTNARFMEFMDAGAYRDPAFWPEPFELDGRTLEWEEAMDRFRDATGQPGPSTWEVGGYPESESDHPVGGVSWHEALAYCRWQDKDLPTVFHWRMAAGSTEMFSDILWASNFEAVGSSEVGSHPGISRYGAYDMAGNAKEWVWNAVGEERYILGGGWNEPVYRFTDPDAQAPMDRLGTYGFRCARFDDPPDEATIAPLDPRGFLRDAVEPVGDEIYQVLLRSFDYDDTPLNPVLEAVDDEGPYWRRETVTLDAAYGNERFAVHLYFPRDVSPPYQPVVYYPSGASLRLRQSGTTDVSYVSFIPRSGRVLVHPVLKGTYERRVQVAGPQGTRDVLIQRTKDLSRTVDYLLTRDDMDPERIAYLGLSLGASTGPISTAVERRFAASILVGGGLQSLPHLPEVDPPNHAPRVRVPTLMINGRHDFMTPYERSQRPLYDLLGTPDTDKDLKVFETGHVPDSRDVIRESNLWLDRYLGPVHR